jgi:hypothetical protein
MADIAELQSRLVAMPRREYAELIRSVDSARRQHIEDRERAEFPSSGISRDDFAVWIARRHHAIDKGITQVIYLPQDAPRDEVRLLEVNELANLPEDAPIIAVDFMPDIDGIPYTVFVADVTPLQWKAIQEHSRALPTGWNLEGSRTLIGNDA